MHWDTLKEIFFFMTFIYFRFIFFLHYNNMELNYRIFFFFCNAIKKIAVGANLQQYLKAYNICKSLQFFSSLLPRCFSNEHLIIHWTLIFQSHFERVVYLMNERVQDKVWQIMNNDLNEHFLLFLMNNILLFVFFSTDSVRVDWVHFDCYLFLYYSICSCLSSCLHLYLVPEIQSGCQAELQARLFRFHRLRENNLN